MKVKITEEQFEELENAIWLEFLNKASALEIHKSLITSNWDGNDFLLNWIKDNPKVDKATILITYWMSAPRWMKQYTDRDDCAKKASWEVDDFDFVEELEHKYINGFFTESNIELDPANDHQGEDWTNEYMDKTIVRDIPTIMYQKLEGEKIEEPDDFDEGLPMEYTQRVYNLFDVYDVEED